MKGLKKESLMQIARRQMWHMHDVNCPECYFFMTSLSNAGISPICNVCEYRSNCIHDYIWPLLVQAKELLFLFISFCALNTKSSGFENSVNLGMVTGMKAIRFPYGISESGLIISLIDL